ncbi:MAG: 3'-5' exonuclease [Magnetococcales bacterium]|nr:3'-5' exonuclease [Magnetococcales bacterium]
MTKLLQKPAILEMRRRWLLRRVPPGVLRDYLSIPFPSSSQAYEKIDYLALDLETTGLDPIRDEILSVGFVPIRASMLRLAERGYHLVRPKQSVPEASAVLTGLTDDHSAKGEALCPVLEEVIQTLTGKVLVAHFARLETGFLDAACQICYGFSLPIPVVDTLALEHRSMQRRNQFPKAGELRLAALRTHYGLPRYKAHNALSDALSCGELFLAQTAHRAGRGKLLLGELV